MQRLGVGIRIDRDRADPQPPRGADHPARDLAAIGDEEGGDHANPPRNRGGGPRRAARGGGGPPAHRSRRPKSKPRTTSRAHVTTPQCRMTPKPFAALSSASRARSHSLGRSPQPCPSPSTSTASRRSGWRIESCERMSENMRRHSTACESLRSCCHRQTSAGSSGAPASASLHLLIAEDACASLHHPARRPVPLPGSRGGARHGDRRETGLNGRSKSAAICRSSRSSHDPSHPAAGLPIRSTVHCEAHDREHRHKPNSRQSDARLHQRVRWRP